MKENPKIEMRVDEVKDVWVAWTNTDLTEGKGLEVPLCVAESQETAQRLGAKGYVMGLHCPVQKAQAFRLKGTWLVPGRIASESKDDTRNREACEAREAVLARAKVAGLSDADLALLSLVQDTDVMKSNTNAKDIVAEYLKTNGFDGLAGDECSCELADLMPCGEFGAYCRPGYRVKCQPGTCAIGGGCDFHMSTRKPRRKA